MRLCGCGCGRPVEGVYRQTRRDLGHVAGQPRRYRHGHRAETATAQIAALTDLEIAWIAGLLEGEGSFGIARRVVKNKVLPDRLSLQPVARIGMTDRDVIERFARLVGVAFNQQHTRRGARKPLYQAAVSNRRALLLMERIRPMMGERRQRQIDAAVSGSNSPRLAAAA